MKTKTIVFDLDDTIVKEIEYLKSAFCEIVNHVNSEDVNLYNQMMEWYFQKENVFQNLIKLNPNLELMELKNIYRNHHPNFNSQSLEKHFLTKLKEKNYKLGLITDGFSVTQRNKIKALDIENLFDLIVISEEFGTEKPNLKNYEIFHQFNTEEYYYIGDNVSKDFVSPNQLGWKTIGVLDDGNNIHNQDFNKDAKYLPLRKVKSILELKF